MNILTLDPSLTCTGYAVVDSNKTILSMGCIQTKPEKKTPVSISNTLRLIAISEKLSSLIKEFNIKEVIFEDPAGSKSAKAATALAMVKGVVIGVIISNNCSYHAIRARKAKLLLSGDANAEKDTIFEIVCKKYDIKKALLEKPKYEREAISDALAVSISYIEEKNDTKNT